MGRRVWQHSVRLCAHPIQTAHINVALFVTTFKRIPRGAAQLSKPRCGIRVSILLSSASFPSLLHQGGPVDRGQESTFSDDAWPDRAALGPADDPGRRLSYGSPPRGVSSAFGRRSATTPFVPRALRNISATAGNWKSPSRWPIMKVPARRASMIAVPIRCRWMRWSGL